MTVLISGASGTIGRMLIRELEGECDLRLLSRKEIPGDPRWWQVDVTDFQSVEKACQGVDTVIHLAIATGQEGDYEDDIFNRERLDTNVKGTYNVFEAARRGGVGRFIYTSSLTVVWGYPAPTYVDGDAPAKPVGTYALTKHLGEQIACYYASEFEMSVICLRIPKPIDIEDPQSKAEPILPQWIAFPDLIQAYRLSIEVQDVSFEVITVVGESSVRRWDLGRAESILGYQPTFNLEEAGYTLRVEPSAYDRDGVVWGKN